MAINDMIVSDYFDKGTDFSATDFNKSNYQLWMKRNFESDEQEQSLEAWVGQLVHNASYNTPEIDVIKEFSCQTMFDLKYTIGGSVDRLSYDGQQWIVEDIKTQGMYPAKSNFKKGGSDSWKIQLSIYAWILRKYGFKIANYGHIHQYVMGFTKNKDGMEKYNKITIELYDDELVESLIEEKLRYTEREPISVDCESWACGYCDYTSKCKHYKGE